MFPGIGSFLPRELPPYTEIVRLRTAGKRPERRGAPRGSAAPHAPSQAPRPTPPPPTPSPASPSSSSRRPFPRLLQGGGCRRLPRLRLRDGEVGRLGIRGPAPGASTGCSARTASRPARRWEASSTAPRRSPFRLARRRAFDPEPALASMALGLGGRSRARCNSNLRSSWLDEELAGHGHSRRPPAGEAVPRPRRYSAGAPRPACPHATMRHLANAGLVAGRGRSPTSDGGGLVVSHQLPGRPRRARREAILCARRASPPVIRRSISTAGLVRHYAMLSSPTARRRRSSGREMVG